MIKKYKNKNERQKAIKQITHKLDAEAFGITYKKVKNTRQKTSKNKAREVKDLSHFMKEKLIEVGKSTRTLKDTKSINEKVWKVGKIAMGLKLQHT